MPTRVGTSSGWTEAFGGMEHTCGLDAGSLRCWGNGSNGQLGIGSLWEMRAALLP